MADIYKRPTSILPTASSYCPGCLHATATRIIAEAIDELGQQDNVIYVLPVGCSTQGLVSWDVDIIGSAHGRAPAVATGIKRCRPDCLVFCYQGDGDLASIGLAEIMSAANRGENITVIFVNNAIYGMTGGQMAPTTLPGQVTQTTPYGRDVKVAGNPVRVCELLSSLDGPALLQRVTCDTVPHIREAKKAILKGFQNQLDKKGFSLIEVVSTCPTNWGLSPVKAIDWLRENMLPYYPLGVYKEV